MLINVLGIINKGKEMSEWFTPTPEHVVRQGDILIRMQEGSSSIRDTYLVITADCDINKYKFGTHLACLKIISFEAYVRNIWAGAKLEKVIQVASKELREQAAKWHKLALGEESGLTTESVSRWALGATSTEICDALSIPNTERAKFVKSVESFKAANNKIKSLVDCDPLTHLAEYTAELKNQPLDSTWTKLLQQAQGESLPEDVFILSNLPQIDYQGAIILLRELHPIAYSDVYYRASDARAKSAFLRAGRLEPQFKYAVSQSFGTLYSRIGLSTDYEKRRKAVVDSVASFANPKE
jgi:hypothetical protein